MGPTKAKNVAVNIVKSITDVGVSVYQGCNTAISQSQTLSINGVSGTQNIGDIDWSQVVTANIACVQNSQTSTAIDDAVTQAATQAASATSQALQLPSGGTDAINIAKQITAVGEVISLAFKQECSNLINQNQTISITDITGTQNLKGLNWNQTAQAISQCIQTTDSVTQVTNTLTQTLEQTATATVESFLGPFVAIIIVIIIVIGLVIYRGVGALTNWKFLLVVGGAVALYFILAAIFKWPPFKKSDSSSSSSSGNTPSTTPSGNTPATNPNANSTPSNPGGASAVPAGQTPADQNG